MTDLAGLSVSPHHATECVVSTDNFEFFTELTNILVQVSKPDTNVSPDTQGLAIAAKMTALLERIQQAHITIQSLPSIHLTVTELQRILDNYTAVQTMKVANHDRSLNTSADTGPLVSPVADTIMLNTRPALDLATLPLHSTADVISAPSLQDQEIVQEPAAVLNTSSQNTLDALAESLLQDALNFSPTPTTHDSMTTQ
ncbi:hypothetical protein BATDEDRAFT_21184 [Batrachochytrium dendrobatidis JAM81]|uniref:Uncharacterized protein n=2 Tax=Batrachochytrium dendrobatidis TaxID=109871 RepID=F4NRL0_BATDJ|nr:uncharacterized protein BATDEDRAFT_21184 [Batrachochytrium dendrobatidis JAM81]EGF83748.1 hypothetical protein BATDEDRAFT_21184 [Batrachochytrium dendrobatidis JAM81]OAJ35830.1 hypothetical protein BDEG_20062 [Batrachochytrium dendrobatidis JEL423]|eukprot:XP_006675219.1 hypothetical protein BATDEDRAFT_21184 [Batrachochytrium dendrobatidis JAM81]